jgi:hypothetical protein
MSTKLISNPFDPISDDQLRTFVRAMKYKWLVRESAKSEWHLLAGTYSMRQMSDMVKEGRFVDIEVVELRGLFRNGSSQSTDRSEVSSELLVVADALPMVSSLSEAVQGASPRVGVKRRSRMKDSAC